MYIFLNEAYVTSVSMALRMATANGSKKYFSLNHKNFHTMSDNLALLVNSPAFDLRSWLLVVVVRKKGPPEQEEHLAGWRPGVADSSET
jgi:hypothetical protein